MPTALVVQCLMILSGLGAVRWGALANCHPHDYSSTIDSQNDTRNARALPGPLTRARRDSVSAWRLCTWHEVLCNSVLRAAASFSSWVCATQATSTCWCGESSLCVSRDTWRAWTLPSLSHLPMTTPLPLTQSKQPSDF